MKVDPLELCAGCGVRVVSDDDIDLYADARGLAELWHRRCWEKNVMGDDDE